MSFKKLYEELLEHTGLNEQELNSVSVERLFELYEYHLIKDNKKTNIGEYSITVDVDTDKLVRKLDVIRQGIEFVVDELEEIDAEDNKFIDDVL
ncbi:hypothetical protein [Bacillus seohaeanensis]|uniref:Uncharacterized protein n=1 Tax=Bacillus seohaeanensis TaxID=284580 RepID=A0ABW5RT91_9BACI